MDKKWHYTKDNDYPVVFGEYSDTIFPQIPCLVQMKIGIEYGVRYWNVEYQVWDSEDMDDYECEKDGVERWMYLDSLIDED
jgi:hypothetical protein